MTFLIGTGIILLIIICIGFFGSTKFALLARDKGYSAQKAKRYPWVIAAATLTLMLLGQMILSYFTPQVIWLGWGSFTVLLLITVLRKAYKNMQLAPSKGEVAMLSEAEKIEVKNGFDLE